MGWFLYDIGLRHESLRKLTVQSDTGTLLISSEQLTPKKVDSLCHKFFFISLAATNQCITKRQCVRLKLALGVDRNYVGVAFILLLLSK